MRSKIPHKKGVEMSANENQSPKSQADILRDIIDEKIESGFDFSSDSQKRELKDKIWQDNPNLFPNKGALASQFYKILKKQLVKHKKDPREYGMSARAPKISLGDSDMKSNIKLELAPTEPTDAQKMEAAKHSTSAQSGTTATTTEGPKPWTEGLDVDSVSASFSMLYLTLKMGFPELEALTEDEKKSLGKLWLPAFKKYLSEMQAIVVIPLIATLGMFGPKIAKARKVGKEKKQEKPKEETKNEQVQ